MQIPIKTFEIVLLLATMISLFCAILSWQRKNTVGAISIFFLMLSIAEWTFSEVLYQILPIGWAKMFFFNLRFLGIACVPVSWLMLAMRYTKKDRFITSRNIFILSILPILTILILWTNPLHHLFYTSIRQVGTNARVFFITENGFWFWVNAYYSYLLVFLANYLLLGAVFTLPKVYRKQTLLMLFGAFIPLIGNILSVYKLIPFKRIDLTPLFLLLTGLLFFWGIFRYRLFDFIPVARNAIIENMKDIIMVLDNGEKIIDLNPAAKQLAGIKDSYAALGQPLSSIFPQLSTAITKVEDNFKTNEKLSFSMQNNAKYFSLSISPLNDRKNKPNGYIVVLRDITELEEASLALEKSREAAEAANHAKSMFLANMSHEIRTPINVIMGITELVKGTNLSIEQQEYVEIIDDTTDTLLSIINEILDLSKIEAGKLKLESINFNIRHLIDYSLKGIKLHANDKNLYFTVEIDETLPEILVGDPTKLKQILANLTSNAVKFTSQGGISLTVKPMVVEKDRCVISFTVKDTGIGMPHDKIPSLFESFHQLDISTTRKYGGTGLGLTITKHLVEMMQGHLTVDSELQKGSSFTFVIPFNVSGTTKILPEKASNASPIPHCSEYCFSHAKKILLAEDSKANQFLMLKLLKKVGLQADVANNGKEVIELFDTGDYSLILSDIQMPEMDGYQTTCIIRQKEQATGGHIPIIAITANALSGDKERCLACGMDDYLSKPIRSQALYAMLAQYLTEPAS